MSAASSTQMPQPVNRERFPRTSAEHDCDDPDRRSVVEHPMLTIKIDTTPQHIASALNMLHARHTPFVSCVKRLRIKRNTVHFEKASASKRRMRPM